MTMRKPKVYTRPQQFEAMQYDGSEESAELVRQWIENDPWLDFTVRRLPSGSGMLCIAGTRPPYCYLAKTNWIVKDGRLNKYTDETFKRVNELSSALSSVAFILSMNKQDKAKETSNDDDK